MLTAQQLTVALAKYCTPGVASMGGSGWWLDLVVAGWIAVVECCSPRSLANMYEKVSVVEKHRPEA